MLNYVTIKKFSELSGYSENAIRTKIRDGVWLENVVWVKAPDGRNLIAIEGYYRWVKMAGLPGKLKAHNVQSPLPMGAKASKKQLNLSPAPLRIKNNS